MVARFGVPEPIITNQGACHKSKKLQYTLDQGNLKNTDVTVSSKKNGIREGFNHQND